MRTPDMVAASRRRRAVFSNLARIQMPVGALTSITHRVTGIFLAPGVPFSVYLLDLSLQGPQSYARVTGLFDDVAFRIVAIFFGSSGNRVGDFGAILEFGEHASEELESQVFLVAQSVRAVLDDTDLVVESLDESERDLVLGLAVGGDAIKGDDARLRIAEDSAHGRLRTKPGERIASHSRRFRFDEVAMPTWSHVSSIPEHGRKPVSTPLPGRFTLSNDSHDFLKTLLFIWVLAHHVLAGIRHLLSDVDIGSQLSAARRSAWVVNVGGIAIAALALRALL
jgi:succinate dehydrogenase/fumarate reductase cytochrome b subunit